MAVILAVGESLGHLSKLYRTQAGTGPSGARLACGHSRAHNTSKLGRGITCSASGPGATSKSSGQTQISPSQPRDPARRAGITLESSKPAAALRSPELSDRHG